jgi:hypothetical protein
LNDPNICKNTLSKLASPEFKAALSSAIDSVQKGESKFVADQKELSSAYNSYLDALVKQRAKLQEKLSSSQSAFQIGSNLWALLLILAFACVATILGIGFVFSENIQMEWVASGQVIQFVTVMILLIVILTLGLSQFLKETVLGTLLGGIGGYVLAQGVGRATARDVRVALQPPSRPARSDDFSVTGAIGTPSSSGAISFVGAGVTLRQRTAPGAPARNRRDKQLHKGTQFHYSGAPRDSN